MSCQICFIFSEKEKIVSQTQVSQEILVFYWEQELV